MRADKKQKRQELKNIKTKKEYNEYMDAYILTDEERKICDMIFLKGWTYIFIAEEMGLAESTVKQKVGKIFEKLL